MSIRGNREITVDWACNDYLSPIVHINDFIIPILIPMHFMGIGNKLFCGLFLWHSKQVYRC